jgi:two-component system sensor kinase
MRTQELEAFAYSVSHDLRAPLRAIDGFAGILSEDHASGLDAEGNRAVAVIGKNARRMGQLIDDILAFSRIGRQEMRRTVVPMHDIVQEVYDELTRAEGERTIRLTLAPLPPAEGDPHLIRQVMQNLLGNSIKYTRPKETSEIEIGCSTVEGENLYYVRDNGVGFDMKYAGKLFGVFQRLHGDEEFEGTGIGLALVQRIISRHGGRIWGEGKRDEGATFYFTLPPARGEQ